jgi:predicted enzyme related to lactoylglutathione lyase
LAKVIGIGGLYFKSTDPSAIRMWYNRVLGIAMEERGAFFSSESTATNPDAGTAFSVFTLDASYFEPSQHDFMFSFMVDDLAGILANCAKHGVQPLAKSPDMYSGNFAHIIDPEGRKIELWQPGSLE